eukprot:5489161-Alexandrium_andersonii.AAC.1
MSMSSTTSSSRPWTRASSASGTAGVPVGSPGAQRAPVPRRRPPQQEPGQARAGPRRGAIAGHDQGQPRYTAAKSMADSRPTRVSWAEEAANDERAAMEAERLYER